MTNKLLSLATCSLLLFCALNSAVACKWCPPDAGSTILRQLDASNAAVLAELVQLANRETAKPQCVYRVVKVLKGDSAAVGDRFGVPLDVQSAKGTVHLFFSTKAAESGDDEASEENEAVWNNPLGLSPLARSLIEAAAELPQRSQDSRSNANFQRLRFMMPHLGSPDRQIAKAAQGEFSAADYFEFQRLKMYLNHRKLIKSIQSSETLPANRRHLFMLLSVCGNRYDYFTIEDEFERSLAKDYPIDLDANVVALITTGRAQGLAKVCNELDDSSVGLTTKRALVNGLRFHAELEVSIKKSDVLKVFRQLLKDPKTADLVLDDLTRWQDWDSLDQVLSLWQERDQSRWLRYPLEKYLNACPLRKAQHVIAMSGNSKKN